MTGKNKGLHKINQPKVLLILLGLIIIAVFIVSGLNKNSTASKSTNNMSTTASTGSDWDRLAQPWNCPFNNSGVPADLQSGSNGNCVKFLQFTLNIGASGGNINDVKIGSPVAQDGKFGSTTQMYVQDLQEKTGLTVNGVVNKDTWLKIKSCINVNSPVWTCPKL